MEKATTEYLAPNGTIAGYGHGFIGFGVKKVTDKGTMWLHPRGGDWREFPYVYTKKSNASAKANRCNRGVSPGVKLVTLFVHDAVPRLEE